MRRPGRAGVQSRRADPGRRTRTRGGDKQRFVDSRALGVPILAVARSPSLSRACKIQTDCAKTPCRNGNQQFRSMLSRSWKHSCCLGFTDDRICRDFYLHLSFHTVCKTFATPLQPCYINGLPVKSSANVGFGSSAADSKRQISSTTAVARPPWCRSCRRAPPPRARRPSPRAGSGRPRSAGAGFAARRRGRTARAGASRAGWWAAP